MLTPVFFLKPIVKFHFIFPRLKLMKGHNGPALRASITLRIKNVFFCHNLEGVIRLEKKFDVPIFKENEEIFVPGVFFFSR